MNLNVKRLKQAMTEKGLKQNELALQADICKSNICQYLSGKTKPSAKALDRLAKALDVPPDYLSGEDDIKAATLTMPNLPVATAARLMGVSPAFIRTGLQSGNLPFGAAVKVKDSSQYTYYISPIKFSRFTGLDLTATN